MLRKMYGTIWKVLKRTLLLNLSFHPRYVFKLFINIPYGYVALIYANNWKDQQIVGYLYKYQIVEL